MIDEKVEAMARVIYESTEPLLKPNFWDDWTLTDFAKADLHTRHAHHTMARAVLQALSPGSTGETDGWVLVPKEPTEAMLVAVTADLRGADHMPGSYDLTDADWAKRFYRAMLAAAGGRDE